MGLFSFIKDAGEKLFGGKEAQAATAAAPAAATPEELNARAAQAIAAYIGALNRGVSGLQVAFDAGAGKVTVQGQVTYRVADPKILASLMNFTLKPNGEYVSDDPTRFARNASAGEWAGGTLARTGINPGVFPDGSRPGSGPRLACCDRPYRPMTTS